MTETTDINPIFRGEVISEPPGEFEGVARWVSTIHGMIASTVDTTESSALAYWTDIGLSCGAAPCMREGAVPAESMMCRLCFIEWPHEDCPTLVCDLCGQKIGEVTIDEISIGQKVWVNAAPGQKFLTPGGSMTGAMSGALFSLVIDTVYKGSDPHVWGSVGKGLRVQVAVRDLSRSHEEASR